VQYGVDGGGVGDVFFDYLLCFVVVGVCYVVDDEVRG